MKHACGDETPEEDDKPGQEYPARACRLLLFTYLPEAHFAFDGEVGSFLRITRTL